MSQVVEGQNLQYLKKGTANAVSLTATFWVKSTKTGTFIVELFDNNNSRSISKSYTVSVTNTWEFKTVTFAGDTTGAFTNNNSDSLYVNFWLGAGSTYSSGTLNTSWNTVADANRAVGQVNIADNTANDFLITGIQLEAGTSATDFEFLPIDVSLGRCLRYFNKFVDGTPQPFGVGVSITTSQFLLDVWCPVTMRTAPSVVYSTGSGYYNVNQTGGNTVFTTLSINQNSTKCVMLNCTGGTFSRAGDAGVAFTQSSSANASLDAEL